MHDYGVGVFRARFGGLLETVPFDLNAYAELLLSGGLSEVEERFYETIVERIRDPKPI